ncbi:uncharacterized protein LOC142345422 [Convolutriloba macropyga]|uniref:uncharacterized protein LOC142345422 n=1 Tax=Convolutriloba macropyga TaxID=536237 RepID=UPI003F51D4B5
MFEYDDPIKTFKALSIDSCFVACRTTSGCVGFSYCPFTTICSAYSMGGLSYKAEALSSLDCQSYPSEPVSSSRKWYMIASSAGAATTQCSDIKKADNTSSNGYYTIKVHGNDVTVYCRMSASTPETFIDLVAKSQFSGNWQISNQIIYKFNKVELKLESCLVAVNTGNYAFSSIVEGSKTKWSQKVSENGVGRGKACPGSGYNGKTQLDLRNTQFQIPAWLKFQYRDSKSARQLELKVDATSGCSLVTIFSKENGTETVFDQYFPLQLYWT